MRKLIVACPCGQRMQVARSAFGKLGVCPKCGMKIRVGANGLEPLALPAPGAPAPGPSPQFVPPHQERQPFQDRRPGVVPPSMESDNVKRKFGEAVDLFYRAHYAEALGILDGLIKDCPGNLQVEAARVRCMDALKSAGSEHTPEKDATPSPEPEHAPQPAQAAAATTELTVEAVRTTVLALMQHGTTDAIRLQAAELAWRILNTSGEQAAPAETKGGLFFMNMARANGNSRYRPEDPAHDESIASLAGTK